MVVTMAPNTPRALRELRLMPKSGDRRIVAQNEWKRGEMDGLIRKREEVERNSGVRASPYGQSYSSSISRSLSG